MAVAASHAIDPSGFLSPPARLRVRAGARLCGREVRMCLHAIPGLAVPGLVHLPARCTGPGLGARTPFASSLLVLDRAGDFADCAVDAAGEGGEHSDYCECDDAEDDGVFGHGLAVFVTELLEGLVHEVLLWVGAG